MLLASECRILYITFYTAHTAIFYVVLNMREKCMTMTRFYVINFHRPPAFTKCFAKELLQIYTVLIDFPSEPSTCSVDCQWTGVSPPTPDSSPGHEVTQRSRVVLPLARLQPEGQSQLRRERVAQVGRLRHQSGLHGVRHEGS